MNGHPYNVEIKYQNLMLIFFLVKVLLLTFHTHFTLIYLHGLSRLPELRVYYSLLPSIGVRNYKIHHKICMKNKKGIFWKNVVTLKISLYTLSTEDKWYFSSLDIDLSLHLFSTRYINAATEHKASYPQPSTR